MMRTSAANQYRFSLLRAATALYLAFVLAGCKGPATDAETEVRQWVAAAELAATEKRRRDLLALISPNYGDSRGNEREDIDKLLRAYFLRQSSITLLTSIDSVATIGEGAAEVELTVGMAGQSGGVFGFSADAYRFRLEMQLEDDDWRLVSAMWGEVGGELR